jgi:hypothetical protein
LLKYSTTGLTFYLQITIFLFVTFFSHFASLRKIWTWSIYLFQLMGDYGVDVYSWAWFRHSRAFILFTKSNTFTSTILKYHESKIFNLKFISVQVLFHSHDNCRLHSTRASSKCFEWKIFYLFINREINFKRYVTKTFLKRANEMRFKTFPVEKASFPVRHLLNNVKAYSKH